MHRRTLMAVFAHPDDEAFGTGGTLARYAAEGADVHLVTATRGEAGNIAKGVIANPANLPDIRELELRCACEAYRISPPHFLGFMDGQLTIVHQGQAVGKIVRLIRRLRPQVVITFGPDGIYGHYDHIAVHRWVTIAVELATDPDCFPDHPGLDVGPCAPYQVPKVYYVVMPDEDAEGVQDADVRPGVLMDGVPFPFVAYPHSEIHARIDVSAYVERKLEGLRCHASQVSGSAWVADEVKGHPGFRVEHYKLARSRVGWPQDGTEGDLFARLV